MAQSSPILNHKNQFLFSFTSKTSNSSSSLFISHPHYSLRLAKPPLSLGFSSSSSSSSSSSPSSSTPRCPVVRVTTVPVEFAEPPPSEFDLRREISRLKALRSRLSRCKSVRERLRVVDGDPRVKDFFSSSRNGFSRVLSSLNLSSYEVFLLKCLVASGQKHVLDFGFDFVDGELESARGSLKSALYALVGMIEKLDVNGGGEANGIGTSFGLSLNDEDVEDLRKLLKILEEVEQFYDCIGGIIGYQITVLELLAETSAERQITKMSKNKHELMEIHAPSGLDLTQNTEYALEAALWGIEGLPYLGEIYPLGGSADRLGFVDPDTGECLPAAMLPYCGRTLLEGLIRDLQRVLVLQDFWKTVHHPCCNHDKFCKEQP